MNFNEGLMVLVMISYCLIMLIFFISVITRIDPSDSNSKYCSVLLYWIWIVDFLTEKTQVSQMAQYEGARPSKVKNPAKISDRLLMDSEIVKYLPSQNCDMITVVEMV